MAAPLGNGGKLRGKRKFVMSMTGLFMSFILALIGVVDGGQWIILVPALVAIDAGGNVMAKKMSNGAKTP